MELQIAFKILGELIDQYESDGRSVKRVDSATAEAEGGALRAAVELQIPFDTLLTTDGGGKVTPRKATLADGGIVQLSFPVSPLCEFLSTATDGVSVTETDLQLGDDHLLLTVEVTVETAKEGKRRSGSVEQPPSTDGLATVDGEATSEPIENSTDETTASDAKDMFAAVRDESLPPYEDTDYLQLLYNENDSFGEMSQRIKMDVSSETVRRYMIEAGIHQPNSYDTASIDDEEDADTTEAPTADEDESPGAVDKADDTDTRHEACGEHVTAQQSSASEHTTELIPDEQIVTDGFGLPDGVRIEDIADAVAECVTVYEVHKRLELAPDQTRELLAELDLLDLVLQPISDMDRTVSYGQIADRIRRCTSSSA